MKFLLVLSALIVVALAAPQNPHGDESKPSRMKEIHEKCQQEAPLPHDFIEKIRNHEKPEHHPENFGKHTLCMAKEFGSVTAEGKVDKDKLKENLEHMPGSNAEKVNAVLEACTKDYESDIETAVKLQECIYHHFVPEHADHH